MFVYLKHLLKYYFIASIIINFFLNPYVVVTGATDGIGKEYARSVSEKL